MLRNLDVWSCTWNVAIDTIRYRLSKTELGVKNSNVAALQVGNKWIKLNDLGVLRYVLYSITVH